MTHFAKVVDGIVVNVIVAEQEFVDSQPGVWVQTSYNTHGGVHHGSDGQPDGGEELRKNFAGIGCIYDSTRDAFYDESPYPSWSLDANCVWQPPTPEPDDGKQYNWDEDSTAWVEIE